jgi:hypothetical protein
MSLTRSQVSLIHVAKGRLGLSDEAYRNVLRHVGGAEHANELDQFGFGDVMDYFRHLGFETDWHRENFGTRPGMASAGQVKLIRALWRDFTSGEGDDRSLGKWLAKWHKVSALRFVTAEQAAKIIPGLKKMAARREAKRHAEGEAHAADS